MWGAASAAYQIEGAWNEDGKGPSVWDTFTKKPGTTFKGSNGDVAVDHYHRFIEDIALMAELGLRAYRFSVSWARIYPDGDGQVNEKGLQFYEDLIDELLKHKITPVLTIFHWDTPQALMDRYGAWESRRIIEDFDRYCRTLFERFGSKVPYWITWNEQNYHFIHGFLNALHPPAVKDKKRFYEANHIAFLANAKVISSFRQMKINGKIGPSFAYSPAYPATCKPSDVLAFENAEDFTNHWWLDMYIHGRYPTVPFQWLKERGLDPTIREEDEALLQRGRPDFIGVNYYQSFTYCMNPEDGISEGHFNTSGKKGSAEETGVPGLYRTEKNPFLERTHWDWNIDAEGLRIGLRRLHSRYNLPLMVTENGLGDFDHLIQESMIEDDARISYLGAHAKACTEAVRDGVPLLGYFVWSFTDVLSWLNGYQKRYGLVYINRDETDPKDLKRIKKKSFTWYQKWIRSAT